MRNLPLDVLKAIGFAPYIGIAIRDKFEYDSSGKRTNTKCGVVVETVIPKMGYEHINVTVKETPLFEIDEAKQIEFDNLELSVYCMNNKIYVKGTADRVKLFEEKNTNNLNLKK